MSETHEEEEEELKEEEVSKQENRDFVNKFIICIVISFVVILYFYFFRIEIIHPINSITAIAVIATTTALAYYIYDWISIKLYILQIEVRAVRPRNRFLINAKIINYGGRVATSCKCLMKTNNIMKPIEMDFVPIDTPTGKPAVFPAYKPFHLLPKVPTWVREYITLSERQKVEIMLVYEGEIGCVTFSRDFDAPNWTMQRDLLKKFIFSPGKLV